MWLECAILGFYGVKDAFCVIEGFQQRDMHIYVNRKHTLLALRHLVFGLDPDRSYGTCGDIGGLGVWLGWPPKGVATVTVYVDADHAAIPVVMDYLERNTFVSVRLKVTCPVAWQRVRERLVGRQWSGRLKVEHPFGTPGKPEGWGGDEWDVGIHPRIFNVGVALAVVFAVFLWCM